MSEPITKKKTSGKKLALIIIPSILVLLIIAIVIIGSIIGKAFMNVGLPVNVVKPEVNDISSSVVTSGTISSANITAYTTSVSATVKDIYIRPGQPISAGDTILTFDTTDLENQYNQASLNARSTQLSSQSTVEASNKTSSDLEQAKANVTSLKAKITALENEIASLQNNTSIDESGMELAAAIAEKRNRLSAVLEEIQAMIDTNPEGTDLTTNPDYITKCAERDTLNSAISNLSSILSSMPNDNDTIAAIISAKSGELASLQGELAAQEALVDSAQNGILTATQREQLNITNQLSSMQVEAAATLLEEGKAGIVADQNGIITSVEITKGSTTAPGFQLFTIADSSSLKVTVPLSKKDLETVALGQSADITILDREYKGEVTYISRMATAGANGATTIEAEVTIQNPDDAIVLGLDAKVVIHTASVKDVLTVPNLAINVDTEGRFVYAVENDIIVKKYVTTGISDVNCVEITDGIDSDTMVITDITANITEGIPVTPILPVTDADNDRTNRSE